MALKAGLLYYRNVTVTEIISFCLLAIASHNFQYRFFANKVGDLNYHLSQQILLEQHLLHSRLKVWQKLFRETSIQKNVLKLTDLRHNGEKVPFLREVMEEWTVRRCQPKMLWGKTFCQISLQNTRYANEKNYRVLKFL